MFRMTRPVGKMSSNKIDDVALVQAALKQIKGSNGRPLWAGPIDGKTGTRDIDSLSAAIAGFESKANLRMTGAMPNSGNAFDALGRALPTTYKDMHGIPGTNIVAGHVARKRPKPDGGVGDLALPETLAADLLALMGRLEKALNYLPTVRADGVDANGHDKVTVDLGLRFLDPQGRIPGKTAPVPGVIKTLVETAVGGSRRFKLSPMQGAQLMLVSTGAAAFPASQLSGGSSNWPVFTGSVGKSGGNAIHDVATLQEALANITTPGASDPFWGGSVDGRPSNDLKEALLAFQAAAGLGATGMVKSGDATVRALSALLPAEFKDLKGVVDMAAVTVAAARDWIEIQTKLLPPALAAALAPINEALERYHGVTLLVREMPRQLAGRLHLRVSFGGERFLDEQGKLMRPQDVPLVVRKALSLVLSDEPQLGLYPTTPTTELVLTFVADAGEARSPRNILLCRQQDAQVGRPAVVTHFTLCWRRFWR